MSLYELKPAFQGLLRPLVKVLASIGVSANQTTLGAIFLSFACGSILYLQPDEPWALLQVPIVCLVRMAMNAIDGMLAREHNMKTDFGACLNELGDVISDAFIYLPFAALFDGAYAPLVVAVVLLATVSEMAGVVGVQIGASRRYDGPAGKSDRAALFAIMAGLKGLGFIQQEQGSVFKWLLLAEIALLLLTVVNRIRGALREKEQTLIKKQRSVEKGK